MSTRGRFSVHVREEDIWGPSRGRGYSDTEEMRQYLAGREKHQWVVVCQASEHHGCNVRGFCCSIPALDGKWLYICNLAGARLVYDSISKRSGHTRIKNIESHTSEFIASSS